MVKKESDNITPMMRQYHSIKKDHHDKLLFFRLGDFYEMFFDDASIASRELSLTLTSRHKVPMCGVPHHAAENYIARLIKKGYKVAMCDQVEDPKASKGVVKREVVSIITPGTVLNKEMLDGKTNNFLAAINIISNSAAISYIDISTGDFYVTEIENEFENKLGSEISRIAPRECIVCESLETPLLDTLQKVGILVNKYPDWVFDYQFSREKLLNLFGTKNLQGFGLEQKNAAITCSGAILNYIEETQKQSIKHIKSVKYYSMSDYMILDDVTVRNLELINPVTGVDKKFTLLNCIDYTCTSMGGRLLRKWLLQPLLSKKDIDQRLENVEYFYNDNSLRQETISILKKIQDIERITSRVALSKVMPKELISLKESLISTVNLAELLESDFKIKLDDIKKIIGLISNTISDEPSNNFEDGNIIRRGYDKELDKYYKVRIEGKDWIVNYQEKERERLKIQSLKVKYNRVFGYYIDVTKANLGNVPDEYLRKQTLVNSERFTTPELQEYEEMILNARDKIVNLEQQLFNKLIEEISVYIIPLQDIAYQVAEIDIFSSFAEIAYDKNYLKPKITEDNSIYIKNGRHTVVESNFNEEKFVPNDTVFDEKDNRILVITGPNMAGKSTYLRQVALIVLLAQAGCFVPADEARIGIVDRIFTRIGASDRLSMGESTFLVEMNETANILNNATQRSLVIMDEIGRGTSTYDGLSIAWAVLEYLHEREDGSPKTLFATHYHELIKLGEKEGIRNLNISVKEWNNEVVFLRKLVEGGADKSYGIEVAKLAGLPGDVIMRSKQILSNLEKRPNIVQEKTDQLNLFESPNGFIIDEIKDTDINSVTPLSALNLISKWKEKIS